jgi:tetratricopeptide (TPR) repeat protein
MNNWREDAAAAAATGKYDIALDMISTRGDLSPNDLVFKGRCIQLSSGGSGREIEDAAAAFCEALALDQNYIPALIELGWLYLSVFDDPERAKQYFDRAIDVVTQNALEAFRGAAQCAEEIAGVEARAEVVKRALLLISAGDLDDSSARKSGS